MSDKISIKLKNDIVKKNIVSKPKIISSFTGRKSYYDEQYEKYSKDPYNVLNVVTIKEQIEGYELQNEIDYLENIKEVLETISIDEYIEKIKKKSSMSKKIIDTSFVGTTYDFQKYFDTKREVHSTKMKNLDEKKRKLERIRADTKIRRIKLEEKKLSDIRLSENQKQKVREKIVRLKDKKIEIDSNNKSLSQNKKNQIKKMEKNKFYPY
jgi:hypothetical protein